MFRFLLEKYIIFDHKLINAFQYVIRQFELYTDVTKKHFLYFCNILTLSVAFIMCFSLIWLDFRLFSNIIVFICSIFTLYILISKVKRNHRVEKTKDSSMGEAMIEIVFFLKIRLLLWFSFFIFSTLVFIDFYTYSSFSNTGDAEMFVLPSLKFSLCLLVCNIIDILVAYIDCTHSLPPGEKKKREEDKKMEKEMQNAVPNT